LPPTWTTTPSPRHAPPSYPPNIAQDVTPERLQKFFVREPDERGGSKVKKIIRDKVVFAVHSVIKDPPFTKLDLLSCRNLLIYLEAEQQERLVPRFHYALKPDGVLFLSSSESITNRPELFAALDRKWKFYRAKASAARRIGLIRHDLNWTFMQPIDTPAPVSTATPGTKGIAELSQRALLQAFAPTSVTTDRQGNILYVHGDASNYLRPPPGLISTQVVEMARPGLQLELRTALLAAASLAKPTLNREVTPARRHRRQPHRELQRATAAGARGRRRQPAAGEFSGRERAGRGGGSASGQARRGSHQCRCAACG
jgi:two-component system CheB/CheR fusion protein